MSTTNYPTHPIFAWRPTIAGSVVWNDGSSSDTIVLSTALASSYWGWDADGSNVATTASIQGQFVALLLAATTATSMAAAYTWPDGDAAPPRTSYTTDVSISLTFSTLAVAAQFGFSTVNPTLGNITATVADFTDAGHWQPSCRGGNCDERWQINPNVGITETIDGSSIKQRTWGTTLDVRPFSLPAVLSANIQTASAAESTFADAAQRNTADPNSLLDVMLEAARTPENTDDARAFRVVSSAGVYRTCYFVDPGQITEVEGLCSNASVRRVWAVSFTMRDSG